MTRVLALERELQKERSQLHHDDPIDAYYSNGGRRSGPPQSSYASYPGSYYDQGSSREQEYLISRSSGGGMGSGRRDPFDGASGGGLPRQLSPRIRQNQVDSYGSRGVTERLGGRMTQMPFEGSSWESSSRGFQQPHW